MHTSFTDQLAGLDLSGFAIGPAPVTATDFPTTDAVVHTLEAVWSNFFAMISGTALETDAEDLGWAFVNIFHRSADRKSTTLDRATDEVRALIATADGSEIHTHELETQGERAQCAESAFHKFSCSRVLRLGPKEFALSGQRNDCGTQLSAEPKDGG